MESNQETNPAESGLVVEVFRPLWALLEIGSIARSYPDSLSSVSLHEYSIAQRQTLNTILAYIGRIGDFSEAAMRTFEHSSGWQAGGYLDVPVQLVVHAGFIEEYPPDLQNHESFKRLIDAGIDRQIANLMNALIGSAASRGVSATEGVDLVVGVIRNVGSLPGVDRGDAVEDAYRLWRVAFMSDVLRPDSVSPHAIKERVREYAHGLAS